MAKLSSGPGNVVLLTGASSGIGLETAVHLARRGYRVFAGMRDLSRRGPLEAEASRRGAKLAVVALDVTDAGSIAAAVDRIVEECGGIGALVSNAGVQIRGYFEDLPESEILRVFHTNVFGSMAVARAVLPHMRRAGAGRIVLVSSVAGRMASVALTAYAASKFALEGFGESLAMEVAPLGIQVSLIEPGIVQSDLWGRNRGVPEAALNPAGAYYDWFMASERLTDALLDSAPTKPADVARAIERAMASRRPRLRYVVGSRAGLLLSLRGWLPFEWFEKFYFAAVQRRITRIAAGSR